MNIKKLANLETVLEIKIKFKDFIIQSIDDVLAYNVQEKDWTWNDWPQEYYKFDYIKSYKILNHNLPFDLNLLSLELYEQGLEKMIFINKYRLDKLLKELKEYDRKPLKRFFTSSVLIKQKQENFIFLKDFIDIRLEYKNQLLTIGKKIIDGNEVVLLKQGDKSYFLFNNVLYKIGGDYINIEQLRLLALDYEDKERKKFESLKKKFDLVEGEKEEGGFYQRERIPEEIRIAVWRRDGGKCARCGSREKLEYDHIVPVSRGGSNTVRNIELLCESCNRKKHDKIE